MSPTAPPTSTTSSTATAKHGGKSPKSIASLKSASIASTSSSSHHHHHHHRHHHSHHSHPHEHEENSVKSLRRAFRSFASSIIVTARAAKQVALLTKSPLTNAPTSEHSGNSGTAEPAPTPPTPTISPEKAKKIEDARKALENNIQQTLKQRQSVRRTATMLEEKLRGNAKELEALHCCLRSTPCVGRKRKFSLMSSGDDGGIA